MARDDAGTGRKALSRDEIQVTKNDAYTHGWARVLITIMMTPNMGRRRGLASDYVTTQIRGSQQKSSSGNVLSGFQSFFYRIYFPVVSP